MLVIVPEKVALLLSRNIQSSAVGHSRVSSAALFPMYDDV